MQHWWCCGSSGGVGDCDGGGGDCGDCGGGGGVDIVGICGGCGGWCWRCCGDGGGDCGDCGGGGGVDIVGIGCGVVVVLAILGKGYIPVKNLTSVDTLQQLIKTHQQWC